MLKVQTAMTEVNKMYHDVIGRGNLKIICLRNSGHIAAGNVSIMVNWNKIDLNSHGSCPVYQLSLCARSSLVCCLLSEYYNHHLTLPHSPPFHSRKCLIGKCFSLATSAFPATNQKPLAIYGDDCDVLVHKLLKVHVMGGKREIQKTWKPSIVLRVVFYLDYVTWAHQGVKEGLHNFRLWDRSANAQ